MRLAERLAERELAMLADRRHARSCSSLRTQTAGYIYVEYLVITVFVTLVCAFAFLKLGPPVMADYDEQTHVLRDEEP
jgi:hypothetical protein